MNEYTVTVCFTVQAETEKQAKKIVDYEVENHIPFKGAPYAQGDSGIVNFGVEQ